MNVAVEGRDINEESECVCGKAGGPMWWAHRVPGRKEGNKRKGRVRGGHLLCEADQCGFRGVWAGEVREEGKRVQEQAPRVQVPHGLCLNMKNRFP